MATATESPLGRRAEAHSASLTLGDLLFDKGLAGRHWSDEALWHQDARSAWREPDLRPMPA